jgi:hypothetical protein
MRELATVLGMPGSTVRGYVCNRKRKRVPPAAARRIANAVLRHRERWATPETWMNGGDTPNDDRAHGVDRRARQLERGAPEPASGSRHGSRTPRSAATASASS